MPRFVFADSVFFISPADETQETVKTGDSLGNLTDEIPTGRSIVAFVTAGPKNYAYQLDDGTSKVTVKGITMNCRNKAIVTFDLIKGMVLGTGPEKVEMVNPNTFSRNPLTGELGIGPSTKSYRKVYTKRALMADGVNTMPFGYTD